MLAIDTLITALVILTAWAFALVFRETLKEPPMPEPYIDQVISCLAIAKTPLSRAQIAERTNLSAHFVQRATTELQDRNAIGKTRDGLETLFWIRNSKITAGELLKQNWNRNLRL